MKIIEQLTIKMKNLDKQVSKVMNYGLIFCFILCILSSFILLTYKSFFCIPTLFYIGISLFRTSLMFASMFLICAIGIDTILNEVTR